MAETDLNPEAILDGPDSSSTTDAMPPISASAKPEPRIHKYLRYVSELEASDLHFKSNARVHVRYKGKLKRDGRVYIVQKQGKITAVENRSRRGANSFSANGDGLIVQNHRGSCSATVTGDGTRSTFSGNNSNYTVSGQNVDIDFQSGCTNSSLTANGGGTNPGSGTIHLGTPPTGGGLNGNYTFR